MISLGMVQTLRIVKRVEFGVYLSDSAEAEVRVLLPKKQVPEYAGMGDVLSVFVYRDSRDRMIATTTVPKLTLHEVAKLRVAQVGRVGAFLDWGLEKELLLPYAEQTRRVAEGEECLVALYIDKSDRLCATMNVYPYLASDSPYRAEDRIGGTVYEISEHFGAFVAVDDRYSGLIPKKELYGNVRVGDVIQARVTGVREDGRLNLSIREKAYLQMDADAKRLLEIIGSFDGVLPFTDKASPEVIRRETQMSKNEFKRAVGRLLKEGKVQITEQAIRLTDR